MPSRLQQILSRLLGNYWFVPSAMSTAAILLSFATVTIDGWLGSDWMHDVSWLWSNKPDGAREVLSTLAGSMITVGGVTFSVTIAAVAYTSSQFAPRLLTNLMQDRGNQITLGTFVSTFLYCLMVLRTVRAGGDGARAEDAFVPQISIYIAVVLAVASVGVLIYFMHHVPDSIHVSNIIAAIGRELLAHLDRSSLHSEQHVDETPDGAEESPPEDFSARAELVTAQDNGYVQHVDLARLVEAARHHGLVLRVIARPGDYIMASDVLALADVFDQLSADAEEAIRCSFHLGGRRIPTNDPMFLVNELTQIAARALSPGVNDPFTAISCFHWLKSGLVKMAQHAPPACRHYDADGALRVITSPVRFDEYADAAFAQLRPYAATDPNARSAYVRCLQDAMAIVPSAEQRTKLAVLGKALHLNSQRFVSQVDAADLDEALASLLRLEQNAKARERYQRDIRTSDGSG